MARDYDDLGMRFELPRSKPKPKGREGPQDADGLDLEGNVGRHEYQIRCDPRVERGTLTAVPEKRSP